MKKILLPLIVLFGTVDTKAQDINSNLVMHYNFASNTATTSTDASGFSGRVASFDAGSGSLTADRKGASNAAYNITQQTAGAGVTVSGSPAITDSVMTMSVWINPTQFTNPVQFNTNIYKKILESTLANGAINFSLYLESGKVVAQINSSVGLSSWKFTNGVSPTLNEWQQIAITFNGKKSVKKMYYYLNGTVQDSVGLNQGNVTMDYARPFKIGAAYTNSAAGFSGMIDEVRFYNRELSKINVKALYDAERNYSNQELNGILNNQFAFYPFNYDPLNNDYSDITGSANIIQQTIPYTYTALPQGLNRFGINKNSLTQGVLNTTNLIGFRIADGNKNINPDSTFSIALWVNNTGATWNNTTLVDASANANQNYKWFTNSAGKMQFNIGAAQYFFQSPGLATNSWTHLAISIDGKNKNLKLFVNGVLKETVATASKFKMPSTNTGEIFFMSTPYVYQNNAWVGGGDHLPGNMDEIRFFKTALNEMEVNKIMNTTGKLAYQFSEATIAYGTSPDIAKSNIRGLNAFVNTLTIGDNSVAIIDPVSGGIKSLKVGVTTLRIQNAGNNNFLPSDTTVKLTITKKDLQYSVNNAIKYYGEENPTFVFSYVGGEPNNGMVNSDDVATSITGTPVINTIANTASSVGTYPLSYQTGSLQSVNYNIVVQDGGSMEIKKNTPVVTLINDSIVYGDTLQLITAKVGVLDVPVIMGSNNAKVTFISGTANAIGLQAGLTDILYIINNSTNYNGLNSGFGGIRVLRAPLTLVLNDQTIEVGDYMSSYYDMLNPINSTYTVTGMKRGDEYYNGLVGYLDFNSNYDVNTSPAGTYTISYTVLGSEAPYNPDDNYYFANATPATLTVIGKRDQYFSLRCGGSKDRLAKGGCQKCSEFFPDKIITDAPYILENIQSLNTNTSEPTGLYASYSIASGPASINGNTITLNGTAGTVTVNINQAGNAEYDASETTTYCFDVTTRVGLDDDISKFNISVYPNPVKDVLYVDDNAQIFNLLGEKVLEGNGQLDVSVLNNGVYFVRIKSTTLKIIKE